LKNPKVLCLFARQVDEMNAARTSPCFVIALVWLMSAASAWADGILTHMSGPVSVRKVDGSAQTGQAGLSVTVGDSVITGSGGYVRMEMSDGSELVLRPDSQLKVESYTFTQAKPVEDSFVFSMIKGGLRTVTGLIGKRGNKDAYEARTNTATIGVRGTQYDLRVCQANCGVLADGTYLAVRFGAIQTSNPQGTLGVAMGQVAFVPPQLPPVLLPRDPGIGFTPPAIIPKLNEKKKIQADAATTALTIPDPSRPMAAATATPAQQGEKAVPTASVTKPTESNNKTEGARSTPMGSSATSTRTDVLNPLMAPTSPAVECSVQ
jgi:hypothetical protein